MSYATGGESAVSFKITNPTSSSSSRPQASTSSTSHRRSSHGRRYQHHRYESGSESDDDDIGRFERRRVKDESISGIDGKGIRSSSAPRKDKPLVIPSAPNKDFRRAALELRAQKEGRQRFIPGQVSSMQGAEAKQRVLTEEERKFFESESNVQRIGDKMAVGGIRQRKTEHVNGSTSRDIDMDGDKTPVLGANGSLTPVEGVDAGMPIDADALALRELLQDHDVEEERETKVHIIPQSTHVTEEEAYALDVAQRPDTPDLEAYQRVPIEDFGAALLRGMGGGNKPRPKVEAYVPKQRTALLGIGAKSREETFGKDWVAQQDNVKKGSNKREQMRFMPLQRVERASSSGTASPAPLPIESMKSEGSSSSRRRRDDDYSDTDDRDRRRKKSSRRYHDEDSEDEARHRRRKRDRSRSPREDVKDRERKESRRGDDQDYDSGKTREARDRDREGSSRRHRDPESHSRRDRDDRVTDQGRHRERDRDTRDRRYRDDDKDKGR